jgi:hypothetical protein
MRIEWSIVRQIFVGIVLLFAGGFITQWLERKPRIVYYLSHVSKFRVIDPNTNEEKYVNTHSIVLLNQGKKTARNVRIRHLTLPVDFTIIPERQYEVHHLQGGNAEITFSELVPGEKITVSYLYTPPRLIHDILSYIKHDDGFGKLQNMEFQRQFSKSIMYITLIFTTVGIIAVLYIAFISLRTLFF